VLDELRMAQAALERRVVASRPVFNIDDYLFGPQCLFIRDPARFKTAVCSRRAGKTKGVGAALLDSALRKPGSVSLYVTLTRSNAKDLIWPTLRDLNERYRLGFRVNEADLALRHPNGSSIMLSGASDRGEIEKRRGFAFGVAVIDEAQSFPSYIQALVQDVIAPGLMDHQGSLLVTGTPGPVPAGWFYDISQNPEWAHHHWTFRQNPYILNAEDELAVVLKMRGVTESDPSIRREFGGEWAHDPNALVFRFDPATNVYQTLPAIRGKWRHVIAVDLGFDDADAIVVLAFCDELPTAYMVEEHVDAKQTISDLADRLDRLVARYDPTALVMDTGGLGRKIAEELAQRRGLPVEAAEKSEKLAHIELLNDALRTHRLFLPPGSRCGEDAMKVEWDKSAPEKPKISDRFHSDALDALLYGFRSCLQWLHAPPVPPPPLLASAERHAQMEAEYLERAERQIQDQKSEERMWDFDTWG
jgi:hypothetical protein